jgi:hypothetical protein
MNEPYIALNVKNSTLYFTKKLPNESSPREILEIDIDEIVLDDFSTASKKLGETVFGVLRLWHQNEFRNWESNCNEERHKDSPESDFEIAMQLISKSILRQTKKYVHAIDLLLGEQAIKIESVQNFVDTSWPSIRIGLEQYES